MGGWGCAAASPSGSHLGSCEFCHRVGVIPLPCGCVERVLWDKRKTPRAPDRLRASLSSPSSLQGPAGLPRAPWSSDRLGWHSSSSLAISPAPQVAGGSSPGVPGVEVRMEMKGLLSR